MARVSTSVVAGRFPFVMRGKTRILLTGQMWCERSTELTGPSCSHFGHDKSQTIKPYAVLPSHPVLFYAGDGVSDLSAASETDLLFAKSGTSMLGSIANEIIMSPSLIRPPGLVTYCEQHAIPFVPFDDWSSILATVQKIYVNE